MGSGKRASMREGPLAALFRKTETEGLEPQAAPAQEPPAEPAAAPAPDPVAEQQPEPAPAPRIPTPQERLRHAFSSDLPENMMSPPSAGRRRRPRRCRTTRPRPSPSGARSCGSSASAAPASTRSTG